MSDKPLVFVSCGQYAEAERALGRDVCALLKELRPDVEAYFDNQSTVEGLSSHILKALYRCAGFVCIMHARDSLNTPDNRAITRGSVWLEQEIAIAAFMNHVLDRALPIFYYKQAGVSLEGIRSVLLMNPRVEFREESEVLEDLRGILPVAQFNPHAEYDLIPVIKRRNVVISGERHVYCLVADVKNVGRKKITDFEMRVFFPRAFLNPNITWGAEDSSRSTSDHICFIAKAKHHAPDGLYPGDGMNNPLPIEYSIDHELFFNADAMRSEIRIEPFSGAMKPKRLNLAIREYQNF